MVKSPTKRQRRRIRLFKALTVLGALSVAWVVGEFTLWISGVNNDYRSLATSTLIPRPDGPFEMERHGHVPYATIRFQYPTDPRGYFGSSFRVDHVFNSVGWRDEEHTLEKPPGTYRILGLGDSYLFGQGVRRRDLCLTRLEGLLADLVPNGRIDTINTGQPGYNTAMERDLLINRGMNYDPDLVILHFVPNDVEPDIYTERPKVEFYTDYAITRLSNDWLSEYSQIWALLRRQYLSQRRGRDYVRQSVQSFLNEPEKWEACQQALESIHRTCQARDVRLLVVIFPFFYQLDGEYPWQVIHERVAEFCESAEIPVLDLREHFRDFQGPELWVHPMDQHPNERAHKLAAEAIADYLRRHRGRFAFDRVSSSPHRADDSDS